MNADTLLIIIAVVSYVIGSFHDGLSNRRVSWVAWHAVNWLRRDILVAAIIWHFYGAPWSGIGVFLSWIMWAGIAVAVHRIMYWLGESLDI